MADLTCERLRELLEYNPTTGIFTWIVRRSANARIGDRAGCFMRQGRNKNGRRVIAIDNIKYLEHRLAWFYMTGKWPENEIDHIDLNGADNCWRNLRIATRSENNANISRRQDNTSGFKGVCWNRCREEWVARTYKNGKQIVLGYFDDPESAYAAYCSGVKKYHGEFARTS